MQVMVRTHIAALQLGQRANSIELKSGPGVGKSTTVYDTCAVLARELDEPVGLITEMLATLQSIDVRGFMIPAKNASGGLDTVFSTPPWFPVRANVIVFTPDGKVFPKGTWDGAIPRVGVCFLDEFGQAEDDTKKAAAELILHGEVGSTRLPEGWRVIAASNRMSDRAGVLRSLTFITNRRMELSIDADLPTWNDWVNALPEALRPHHLTVSFANRQPDLVFRDSVPPGDAPFCTPRTLVLMDRDLRALRTSDDVTNDRLPVDGVARQVCAGWIGGGESAQYFVHVKFADLLPNIEDIQRDPRQAKLPEERSAQMVVAFFLASHLTERNAERIMVYIERLGIEMQVLAVRTINKQQDKAKHLVNNLQFTNWLLRHKDLLIASNA
jgi:hypothetical protein